MIFRWILLMPFNLPLPISLKKARWQVKIREKESREPPHATILRGTQAWRINLRTGEFMDRLPHPDDVPQELLNHVTAEANWERLCEEWDRKYPHNAVREVQDSQEE
jgi:hypothetical protein